MPRDKPLPEVAIFPNLDTVIRTPAGRHYRGRAIVHNSQKAPDEQWLQILPLNPVGDKEVVFSHSIFVQQAKKHGRPDHFPAESTLEPARIAFNRIPADKRTDKNATTLIADFWDADGLWTLLIKPSQSPNLVYVGTAVPSKVELAHPDSRIAQFQRPARHLENSPAKEPDAVTGIQPRRHSVEAPADASEGKGLLRRNGSSERPDAPSYG